ncbi:glycosyltransferase, partial [Patescibacteria group bacterium]|nr:glycosyltransferase [Patescibacteria group bacterium]
MADSQKIKISIIILSWNTKDLLKKCLKSIPFYAEIIIVDNGSTDGTIHFLNSLKWPNLKFIKNKSNLGFAKGNNQGIKAASGDLIMLLNSDTVVEKKTIEKLVNFYQEQKDKNLAFSPLLLNHDGTIQQQYYLKFPNLWQIIFYHNPVLRFLAMKTFLRKLLINDLRKIQKGEPFELSPLQGAALMVSKEV